jgi:hypothetical protein
MLAAFCRIDECALQHAETWRRHKQHSARTGTRKS